MKLNVAKQYNHYAKKWVERMNNQQSPSRYLERSAMYAKLPNLKNKNVLCVGCGAGEECQYIASRGAKHVLGIDTSRELIKIAKENFPEIEFKVMSAKNLSFPKGYFDFIYSSLTMHYVSNWNPIFQKIYYILKNKGTFLFSTSHPIKWGSEIKRTKNKNIFIMGYEKYKRSNKYKIYGDYLNERKIYDVWFDDFFVSFYHKPISSIINIILKNKFEIIDFIEPGLVKNFNNTKKGSWSIYQKIPSFMIFYLRKK